jgi:hypothetical protein
MLLFLFFQGRQAMLSYSAKRPESRLNLSIAFSVKTENMGGAMRTVTFEQKQLHE